MTFEEDMFNKHLDALREAIHEAAERLRQQHKSDAFRYGQYFHESFFESNADRERDIRKEYEEYKARKFYESINEGKHWGGMDWGPIERDDENYTWRVHVKPQWVQTKVIEPRNAFYKRWKKRKEKTFKRKCITAQINFEFINRPIQQ